MAGSRAWIDSTRWDPESQAEFFKRLKRCTLHYQPQHARCKALALLKTGNPERIREAIELSVWILRTYPEDWLNALVAEQIADCHLALGDVDAAIQHLKNTFLWEKKHPGVGTTAWIRFTHLVVSRRLQDHFDQVLSLLMKRLKDDDVVTPSDRFLVYAALTVLAHHREEWLHAFESATEALEASKATHSGFNRHPDFGLVDPGEPLIDQVRKVLADPRVRAAGRKAGPQSHLPPPPTDPAGALEWKLCVQLSELNVMVKSVWDLVNGPNDYGHALPTLLRALESLPRTAAYGRLREGLARALNAPGLKKLPMAAEILIAAFQHCDQHTKWVLAMTFKQIARKQDAAFVLKAVQDRRNGLGREPLLPLLKTLLPRDNAESVLITLLNDDTIGPLWTLGELGYCGTAKAISKIEPWLKSKEGACRKKARWAINRILARD